MSIMDFIRENSNDPGEAPTVKEDPSKITVESNPEGKLGAQRAFFGQFNKVVTALPDLAINAAVYGLEQAGVIKAPEDPRQNRDFLERVFNAANYDQKKMIMGFLPMGEGAENLPTTTTEKIAAGGGEGAALAVPFIGMAGRGAKGATYANEGAELIQRKLRETWADPNSSVAQKAGTLVQDVARQNVGAMRAAPGVTVASETAAGALGSASGTAEQELTGMRTGVADLAGGVVGSTVTSAAKPIVKTLYSAYELTSPVQWAIKGYKELIAKEPSEAMKVTASRKLDAQLQEAFRESVERGDAQRTNEILNAFREVGLEPPQWTPAEATLDPVLKKAQEMAQLRSTGSDTRRNTDRMKENAEKTENFLRKLIPAETDSPEFVLDASRKRIEGERAAIASEMDDVAEQRAELAMDLPRLENRNDPIRKIRETLTAAKTAKKAELDKLAESMGINTVSGTADITQLKQVAKQTFMAGDMTDKYVPSVIRDLVDTSDTTLSFSSYRKYLDKVGEEIAYAKAVGNKKTLTELVEFKQGLEEFADENFKAMAKVKEFRDIYAKEYALPYERGIVYKIAKQSDDSRTSFGEAARYVTGDEQVANAFLRSEENAKDFVRIFQNDPESLQAMRSVIMDRVGDYAKGKDNTPYAGGLNPERLNTFILKNRETLDALGLTEQLSDIQSATAALGSRQRSLVARERAINHDRLTKMLEREAAGDVTADELLGDMLKKGNRSAIRKIHNDVKRTEDPALMETLKSAVMSRVLEGVNPEDPKAFRKAVENSRAALLGIYSKDELDRMELVADAMIRNRFANQSAQGAGIENQSLIARLEDTAGTTAKSFAATTQAIRQGRTSLAIEAPAWFVRYLNANSRRAYDEMFRKNMLDRDFSKDMAEMLKSSSKNADGTDWSPPSPVVERRMRAYMFNQGFGPNGEPYGEPETETIDLRDLPPAPTPKLLGAGNADFNRPSVPPPPASAPSAPVRENNITVTPNAFSGSGVGGPSVSSPKFETLFPNDPLGKAIQERRQ